MKKYYQSLIIGGVLLLLCMGGVWFVVKIKKFLSERSGGASTQPSPQATVGTASRQSDEASCVGGSARTGQAQSPKNYPTKSYAELIGHINGLTESQLKQHYDLYVGYVKKRNQIEQDLQVVDRTNSAGITYSPFRALKVAETFAVNGSLLHELYFENMSAKETQPGEKTMHLIVESFGSLDNFKSDLLDAAGVARGWAITMYGMDDGHIHNYVLESHNQNVPVLSIPLLVLDVYEHAYMIDFGIKRAPYLDIFWQNINWDVVEERVAKWVLPFKNVK